MNKTSTQIKGNAFEWPLVKRLLSYTRPYRGFFILAIVTTICMALIAPIVPYLIQYTIDAAVVTGDESLLLTLVMAILGIQIIRALVQYGNGYLTGWLGQSIIRDLRIQVFQHISRLQLKFFDNTPVGTLQTRTISDVETLNEVFSQGLVNIVGEILQLLAIFAIMFYTSWKLTLIVITTIPLLIFATYIFKVKIKSSFQRVRRAVSEMNAFLQEHITGMFVIKIFNREKEEMQRFAKINAKQRDANLDSVKYYSIFFPVVEVISSLALALIVWFGAPGVISNVLTFGTLVAFIMYMQMFFRPIRMLADRFNTLQLGMVSAERIFRLLDSREKIEDEGTLSAPPNQQGQLKIEFRRVHFAYNEPEWILKDVSFTVNPGEKIAIVGSTGAGKTTIINLLCRFYDIQRGTILINDTDIRAYSLNALREMVGLVLQDVFLFSGNVYENISLNNPEISPEDAQRAASIVGADNFIQRLPGKYQYEVQERGATLSAGQRQLISFARVIAYNPRILILDEATSNIDTDSEQLIQEAIDKVMDRRTSIVIAHRLSTIQKADKILVMEQGEVVEQGTHQELLSLGGIYSQLHNLQFAKEPA